MKTKLEKLAQKAYLKRLAVEVTSWAVLLLAVAVMVKYLID